MSSVLHLSLPLSLSSYMLLHRSLNFLDSIFLTSTNHLLVALEQALPLAHGKCWVKWNTSHWALTGNVNLADDGLGICKKRALSYRVFISSKWHTLDSLCLSISLPSRIFLLVPPTLYPWNYHSLSPLKTLVTRIRPS